MTRKYLLIGISTAALAAGVASAQSNTRFTSSNCGAAGTLPNTCTTTQGASSNENSSSITVTGSGNNVTVDQQNGQLETSIVQITGNTNTVVHTQSGLLDNATTTISGNRNNSAISQDGSRNSASVSLTGDRNSGAINQGTNGFGVSNSATITVTGNSVSGTINQNGRNSVDAANNRAVFRGNNSGVTASTTLTQSSTITQSERGNSATVVLTGGSTTRDANDPDGSGLLSSRVTQQNSFYGDNGSGGFTAPVTTSYQPTSSSNPSTGNIVDVSIAGEGNSSTVFQDGVVNYTSMSINRGGAGVSAGTNNAATTDSNNGLTFTGGQTAGNSANISQIGRANSASISIGGRDAAGQQGLGNRLILNQGTAAVAAVPAVPASPGVPGTPGTPAAPAVTGRGHVATVYQFGQLSTTTINQNDRTGVNGETQNGSTADISQSSFFSTLSLTQNGSNDALLNQGGSVGSGKPASNGTGGQSGNNTLNVSQDDTGDITASGNGGAFPGSAPAASTARNKVSVSQAGRNNVGTIQQSATNASATLFQRLGSANLVTTINQGVNQGFGSTGTGSVAGTGGAANATNVTADVTQGGLSGSVNVRQMGNNLNAIVNQNGSEGTAAARAGTGVNAPVVQISQVGNLNSASVNQTGSNSTATVDQRNANAAGEIASRITITQTGGSGGSNPGQNTAIARQTSTGSGNATIAAGGPTTGPTDINGNGTDPETRIAGAYGNVISITQNNTSDGTAAGSGPNSATVEQQGAGQLARVTQDGFDNEVGLLQTATATNATAIISQTGDNNTFFLTQNAPNQFLRVSQNGNSNTAISGSGANNGGTQGSSAPSFTVGPQ